MTTNNWLEDRMREVLEKRSKKGTLRHLVAADSSPHADSLTCDDHSIDFSSNDYLGIARDPEQKSIVVAAAFSRDDSNVALGATGSRLLSGDSVAFHRLEEYLADVHRRPAALLCNSGYDANLSAISVLLCDCIIHDEYVHNSIHMGIRLWKSQHGEGKSSLLGRTKITASFRHNNLQDLERQLIHHIKNVASNARIIVVVESVYSMDGDVAPIRDMLGICQKYKAMLVVDEAHGLGICGRERRSNALPGTGVLAMEDVENHPSLLCSIHTFGKAAGCHGAVICGSKQFKQYLYNYAYPFIYSTALPPHSLVTIRCAYETMTGIKGDLLRKQLYNLVELFRHGLEEYLRQHCPSIQLLPSTTPIQALMIPGNGQCSRFCQLFFDESSQRIRLYPIKAPTVPAGQERIRIIIHAHNTVHEIEELVYLIRFTLEIMGLSGHGPDTIKSRL